MNAPFSDELLGGLSAFATAQFGLRFPPDRWPELGRGIASAALELGIPDLQGWAQNLAAGTFNDEDRAAVANHLTISETYFFRHPDTFSALERDILPGRLALRREQGRPLRIWSAGCASGEEPYSVAILLRQKFPDVPPGRVVIAGTDLNSQVVARACRGVYSEWSFRDSPPWLKTSWFERTPRGHHQVSPEIRGMVRFSVLNLASPLLPAEFGERADFDVILCRNVLMYFSGEWRDRIIRRFVQSLAPGAWLMIGPCDLTVPEAVELGLRPTSPGFYQKNGRAGSNTVPPPAFRDDFVFPAPAPLPTPTTPPPAPLEPVADLSWLATVPPVPAPSGTSASPLPSALPPEALVGEADEASLASAQADRGQLTEALAACDRAIARDNLLSPVHHLRGCVLLELGRPHEAENAFRRVLYLNPDSVMAEFALASLALRAGRDEEARHRYRMVLRLLDTHLGGEAVPQGEGVTVARLRQIAEHSLDHTAA